MNQYFEFFILKEAVVRFLAILGIFFVSLFLFYLSLLPE